MAGPSIRRHGSQDCRHRRLHSRRAARHQTRDGGNSKRPGPSGVRRRPDSNSAPAPSIHRTSHCQRAVTVQAVRRPAAGERRWVGRFVDYPGGAGARYLEMAQSTMISRAPRTSSGGLGKSQTETCPAAGTSANGALLPSPKPLRAGAIKPVGIAVHDGLKDT